MKSQNQNDIDTLRQEVEVDDAFLALEEIKKYGKTERRCLRCGGEYEFEIFPNGLVMRCSAENRIIEEVRGI